MLPVAEIGEVFDAGDDAGDVVEDDRRAAAPALGASECDGWQAEVGEHARARVVDAKVGEDHTVDPVVVGNLAIGGQFGVDVGDGLEDERCLAGGQLGLDAGNEGGEEGVDGEQLGGSGEDEADGVGAGVDQRPGGLVGPPAELVDGVEDPPACRRGDAGPIVEHERHEPLRHAGAGCDVDDGGPPRLAGVPRGSRNCSHVSLLKPV